MDALAADILRCAWAAPPVIRLAVSITRDLLKGEPPVRTTLESGAWVEHVPLQDLKGRHIRDYAKAAKRRVPREAVDEDGKVDVGLIVESTDIAAFQQAKHDALWAIIITGWSWDVPVPVFDRAAGEVTGVEALDEIPADDYREIDYLLEPFGVKLADKPDPKEAPTGTTSSSSGSSRASGARGSRRG
jgi:hypothetical protein